MRVATKQTNGGAATGYEAELWAMADALRGSKPEARQPTIGQTVDRAMAAIERETLRRWGSGAEKA